MKSTFYSVGIATALSIAGCDRSKEPEVRLWMTYEEVKQAFPSDEKLITTGLEYPDEPTPEQLALDPFYELNLIDEYGFSVGINRDKQVVSIMWYQCATLESKP